MKVIKKNSPNHFEGRKGWKADMVVFHQTGGSSLSPALEYYLNPCAQCSPNYLIDTDGTIYQLVNPGDAAWCNGTAIDPNDDKYYGYSLSSLVRSRKTNANLFTISAEFVHCGQGNITSAQVDAAVYLVRHVIIPYFQENGVTPVIDRKHIISHSEVSPRTRDPEKYNCPGKLFPFEKIISRVLNPDLDLPHEDVQIIYQAVSNAAVRAGMSKSSQLYERVTKGEFYPIDQKYNNNGEIWLKHADEEAFSMLNDGGALFRKVAAYTIKRTTCMVNIRDAASLKGNKVDTLPMNNIVYAWAGEPVITADGHSWVKIIYEGKICYIAGEYLK